MADLPGFLAATWRQPPSYLRSSDVENPVGGDLSLGMLAVFTTGIVLSFLD
jgi:hypothetical protein